MLKTRLCNGIFATHKLLNRLKNQPAKPENKLTDFQIGLLIGAAVCESSKFAKMMMKKIKGGKSKNDK